jgi:hypothetical protein
MTDYPIAVAKLVGEDYFLWVWGAEQESDAVVSKEKPTTKAESVPFGALVSHLYLDEWDMIMQKEFDPNQPRHPAGTSSGWSVASDDTTGPVY